ncbi:methyltransferase domain protein [Aeromicrobium marinum DSM 15272]|uniref:Methyltransferase domain protein n=1 Tax=Aeromicrobium marinum DSM 15272 TaxID=585531 RepID=E2SAK5_9ACTN|nr:methyltransferase domain-containing protein [Aeromicrobium marinum]EFQ83401.1 methyltransferase domain protein [Aeromicrobium marinum DSM 15272]
MGPVRLDVVWQAVLDVVAAGPSGSLRVVDLGGGTGADAVRLARLGHRLTVVDSSPDALASLHRRSVEAGVEDLVTAVAGDLEDLGAAVPDGEADLVLCHGVLEHVDRPATVLSAVPAMLRPGGLLSVLVPGRNAAVLTRAMAGDLAAASRLHDRSAADWDLRRDGPRRFVTAEVEALVGGCGLSVVRHVGRRVVSDLVPSTVVDGDAAQRAALMDLERLLGASEDFTAFSGGLQTIARLDLSQSSPPGGNRAAL